MNIYNYENRKFNFGNVLRKSKNILLRNLYNFIDIKIKIIYNNYCNRLMRIGGKIVSNTNINSNRNLLTKTLLEIFSEDIIPIYSEHLRDHNEKLIQELLNEENNDKRNYFKNLFNLTFLDCLEHFTNKRVIEELQGLKTFLEIKNDENELKRSWLDDKEYLETIEYYLNNLEESLNKKREEKEIIHNYILFK